MFKQLNEELSDLIHKLFEILGSPRFWQLVAAGVVVWLQTGNWKLGVLTVLGGSVGIGTLDRFSKR